MYTRHQLTGCCGDELALHQLLLLLPPLQLLLSIARRMAPNWTSCVARPNFVYMFVTHTGLSRLRAAICQTSRCHFVAFTTVNVNSFAGKSPVHGDGQVRQSVENWNPRNRENRCCLPLTTTTNCDQLRRNVRSCCTVNARARARARCNVRSFKHSSGQNCGMFSRVGQAVVRLLYKGPAAHFANHD